ncbi:MAG TPA: hypothetical protein VH309_05645 [Elusimicrobiota bacterium]|jgi:hypothetical protein|nr:hypothetical protein [Elusimicrobiota bacterium]
MNHTTTASPHARAARLLAALLCAALAADPLGALARPENGAADDPAAAASVKTPENVIRSWPTLARDIAKTMIDEYGLPDHYDDRALVWINNGPWRRTVVFRSPGPARPGERRDDYLEQTINYDVAPYDVPYLRRLGMGLQVDRARGELSSRSDSERLNFLALNMADQIVKGNWTVADARGVYRTTLRLSKAGKSSPYMRGFLFQGHRFMNRIYYP